jgi:DNA-binding Xre family transcriptional regulator
MVRLRVKEIAEKKGMSMGKLSRVADISYKTVKRIYDDPHYSPTLITLGRLAKALGVPTTDLIEDIPDA